MERKNRLGRILEGFSKVKIMVVGDIMIDRFVWGRVSRISPEAPVPVVLVENNERSETMSLGGAANVANNIHSLGGEVLLCGVVGDDEMGQRLLEKLDEIGIQTEGIFTEKGRQTTVKTRIFANQQQVVRIDRETIDHPKPHLLRDFTDFIMGRIEDFDGIVISDYGKGVLTGRLIRAIIRKAKKSRKPVLVDPKLRNYKFYKGATVVTPNTKEASEASRVPIVDQSSIEKIGSKLLKELQCKALVITRGEEGMAIFEKHRKPVYVPTERVEVFDVTGAGDTVIGTLALGLGTGPSVSVKEAAEIANYAAGVVVGKMGTATATRKELIEAMRKAT
ncbi:MAG: D-glycero-beta-D-manno-heptose-7-phosphate kinase [Syntrophaceae bacterium]|nr:D-glycero-beta-D-manno-heptose-7-phosphate kinase [Syntrophaceae bacterium]